jgi:hypothetical protein
MSLCLFLMFITEQKFSKVLISLSPASLFPCAFLLLICCPSVTLLRKLELVNGVRCNWPEILAKQDPIRFIHSCIDNMMSQNGYPQYIDQQILRLKDRNSTTPNPSTINVSITTPPKLQHLFNKDAVCDAPCVKTHLRHIGCRD